MFGTSNSLTYSPLETAKFLSQVQRNLVGIDSWVDKVHNAAVSHSNYPPYNLIKLADNKFKIDIALAGYLKEEIEVFSELNVLYIKGKKQDNTLDGEVIYKGLSEKAFTRSWVLADDIEISKVTFQNGLLTVLLHQIIPEHKKHTIHEISIGD
jgi:molecular chaperone IbpA